MARLYIGTSGWSYTSWRGVFYPPKLAQAGWLLHYAENFDTAEINYSFYHLPRAQTYENWYSKAPRGFVFAVKASRFITHIKRLEGVKESWSTFLEGAVILKEKLGPILLQFPPSFHATPENLDRLSDFLRYATRRPHLRIALEFRHVSCFAAPTIEILKRHQVAMVIPHSTRLSTPEAIATAPFMYFRFHGPEAMFRSSYPDWQLGQWSRPIRNFLNGGADVYVYFNNDFGGNAVMNARTLRAMVLENQAS